MSGERNHNKSNKLAKTTNTIYPVEWDIILPTDAFKLTHVYQII